MLPFIVDKDWYQRYWLTERKPPQPRPRLRPALSRAAFSDLADQVVRWIKTRRQQARDLQTLNGFNDRDLRDIGLTRHDIPGILNGTYRPYQDASRLE
ncbi:DUF1127 domain-containing protein [Rhodopila sp.]|uniref:DUF1127 domain-containing protein n=1 Tax=Rhodopila sp. TaxID=2480087 RepID=UPI003D113599